MDSIPNELLYMILCRYLSCAWAAVASLTCHRWHAIVAASPRRQFCAQQYHGNHVALLVREGAPLSLLGWLGAQGADLRTRDVGIAMAGTDNLDGLLWLRSLGCPIDRRTACPKNCRTMPDAPCWCFDAGCECDAVAQAAVKHGALSVLRWTVTKGGWADGRLVAAAIRSGDVRVFDCVFEATGLRNEWTVAVACEEAAMRGDCAMIDRLCDIGQYPCVYPEDVTSLVGLSVKAAIVQKLLQYRGCNIMWTVD